jgi:hypothetical protein
MATAAGDAPAEPPGFVVSGVPSAASCLVATAGCGVVAAVGSALPEASELPDAVVVAAAAFEAAVFELAAFEVVVLGAEPSDATVAAAVAPVGVVAAALTVGWAGAFVVAAVLVAAPDVDVAVAVASGVVVAGVNDDPGAAVADWLAAIAAAAIASGAVPLPDAGVPVAGVAVTATVTGITTATGLGVAGLAPACGVGVEPLAESADEVSPDDDVAVDCVESSLEVVDLVRERGGASVVVPALASDAGPLLGP